MLGIKPKVIFKGRPARGTVVRVSCTDARCEAREFGWKVILSDQTQSKQVEFIRSGGTTRYFIEEKTGDGLWTFTFPAGQDCFKKHYAQDMVFDIARVETGRPPLWYPDGDAFVGDSDTHLRKLKEELENG